MDDNNTLLELVLVLHEIAASLKEIANHTQQGAQSVHGKSQPEIKLHTLGSESDQWPDQRPDQTAQPTRRSQQRSRPVIVSVSDATYAKDYQAQSGREVYEEVPGFRRK